MYRLCSRRSGLLFLFESRFHGFHIGFNDRGGKQCRLEIVVTGNFVFVQKLNTGSQRLFRDKQFDVVGYDRRRWWCWYDKALARIDRDHHFKIAET